jgi:hypothetical protein
MLRKIEYIFNKVSKLDKIEESQEKISSRLSSIEAQISQNTHLIANANIKIAEIETSQQLMSDKYDTIKNSSNTNSDIIKKLQGEVKVVSQVNKSLDKQNKDLHNDVVDLQCRSMRDNVVILGISEHPRYITNSTKDTPAVMMDLPAMPYTSVENTTSSGVLSTTDGDPMDTAILHSSSSSPNETESVPSSVNHGTYANAATAEDCVGKVYQFIEKILGISDAKSKVFIDRAHRMPNRPISGKTRSMVIKFKDTNSKLLVKNASKSVNLKAKSVAVFDQLPRQVQDRRKELIPVMHDARTKGHQAYLVRDKLYINNVLYSPDSN